MASVFSSLMSTSAQALAPSRVFTPLAGRNRFQWRISLFVSRTRFTLPPNQGFLDSGAEPVNPLGPVLGDVQE